MIRKKTILRGVTKMIEALIAGNPEPLMNADYGMLIMEKLMMTGIR